MFRKNPALQGFAEKRSEYVITRKNDMVKETTNGTTFTSPINLTIHPFVSFKGSIGSFTAMSNRYLLLAYLTSMRGSTNL